MARFSEPKQKRSIMKQYGMYVVKTPDMCTYHREFIDAVESYGVVYGRAPIAGPLEIKPATKILNSIQETKKVMEKTYVKMAEGFEQSARAYEDIMKRSQAAVEISKELRQRMKDRAEYLMAMNNSDEEAA